jgi:hypothetical protein
MTCSGVLNRTRTVDGNLTCLVTGFFRQTNPGTVVTDPSKV